MKVRMGTVRASVERYFEEGNKASVQEICKALGLVEASVVCALRALRAEGIAGPVARKLAPRAVGYGRVVHREVDVWGRLEASAHDGAKQPAGMVERAMANRSALEDAWWGRRA